MSDALSIVLQVLSYCVHHDPFGFQRNVIFILTILCHQVIKYLFPGGKGYPMLLLFSPVEHLNFTYILRFLLFTADIIYDFNDSNVSTDYAI